MVGRSMEKRHPVLERLARGQSVVLDGGVAAELARRGYRPTGPLRDAAAAREVPELLGEIHRAYVDAGVDVVSAFTDHTTTRALSRGGLGMRAAALTHRAVDLALDAVQGCPRPVAVAGVLAALEDAGHTPTPRTLADEHTEQAERLASTGCSLLIVNAMPTLVETLAATAAARAVRQVVWATLALKNRSELMDGAPVDLAASHVAAIGAQVILLEGPNAEELSATVARLTGLALGVPLGIRAAPSSPTATPERFAAEMNGAMQRGVRVVGGSRGATPEHVRALGLRLKTRAAA